jgi:RimJ/RimL family protein N-acetyltransferase
MSYKMLKVFEPDESKVMDLVMKLRDNWLYLSDEYRSDEMVSAILMSHLYGPLEYRLFEMGDWQGLFGVVNIIMGWKADLFFKIWDKSIWGPDIRRELFKSLDVIVDDCGLERIYLQTPDKHTAELAKSYGFKEEGLLKNQFKWNGAGYDVLCLGLNRRD